jgi:hypothetical protein
MKCESEYVFRSKKYLNVLFITHLSACLAYSLILKTEAICSSGTWVSFYQTQSHPRI